MNPKTEQRGHFCQKCQKRITGQGRTGLCGRCVKLGKKLSAETKRKMGEARTGDRNPKWKGKDVGYDALHDWVRRELGDPTYCSNDKTHKSKKYEWANISHTYKRELSDFKPLCQSCHRKYDVTENLREATRKRQTGKPNLINRKSVSQYDLDGAFIQSYASITEASVNTGVGHRLISRVMSGERRTAGRFIWKKVELEILEGGENL